MRMTVMSAGWAMTLAAAALLVAGIAAAAPSTPEFGATALAQVVARQWELARGFQHMLLAGMAMLCALVAFILARMLPND